MKKEYLKRIHYLSFKPRAQWTDYDIMAVSYFLIKQGRLPEAERTFSMLNDRPTEDASQKSLFREYLSAYLKLSRGEIESAFTVAREHIHTKHPIWRQRFRSLLKPSQISLIENNQSQESLDNSSIGRSLNVKIDDDRLLIASLNIDDVQVSLYPINLEILFSEQPADLLGDGLIQAPVVKPTYTKKLALNGKEELIYRIPNEWRNKSVIITVNGGGQSQVKTYSPQHFIQQVFPQKGLLRLRDFKPEANPISGAYVKVYAEMKSGKVKFYKDGYTDHQGMFDYVNANPAPDLSQIKKLRLLTITQKYGSTMSLVRPPAQ